MKKLLVLFNLLLLTTFTFAQDHYLIGKWDFEKIPDDVAIPEGGEMMLKMMKDMSLSFDKENYSISMMGGTENGTWSFIEGDKYQFTNVKGGQIEVELKKISENQISFNMGNGPGAFQMKRSNEAALVTVEANPLDAVQGVDIDKNILIGTWYDNGIVVAEDADDMIKKLATIKTKHSENEITNITFLEDGTFINKSTMEEVINVTYSIKDDNQTLVIDGEEYTEFLKVVKLTATELYLFKPSNKKVYKYKKK